MKFYFITELWLSFVSMHFEAFDYFIYHVADRKHFYSV